MSLLEKRSRTKESVMEKTFIQNTLREEGEEIKKAQEQGMSTFSSDTRRGRSFSTNETTLLYKHDAKHRFIDMRKRNSKEGPKKKKSYKIHNKPIYGVLNNIISRLSYGYTDEVKDRMRKFVEQNAK